MSNELSREEIFARLVEENYLWGCRIDKMLRALGSSV